MDRCGDAAIAIASLLRSQSNNRSRQRILIITDDSRVSLRFAWLAEDPAGMAFGETLLFPNALDRPPASLVTAQICWKSVGGMTGPTG